MTTVKELKEWLNRFPDDTIVQVLKQEQPTFYQEYGDVHFIDLDPNNDSDFGEGWSYTDFTGNKFIKPNDIFYKKRHLALGSD